MREKQEAQEVEKATDTQAHKLEALGQFAGGIAHDFNNILSIVEGLVLVIENRIRDGKDVEEPLEKIKVATQRGASLTRRLLAFSRKKIMVEQVCDLNAMIEDQIVLLKPLLGETIELSQDLASGLAPVLCAPDTIMQILMNILINARDAMPESGGQIGISSYCCSKSQRPMSLRGSGKDYICIMVSDTGKGMDEATLAQALNPFFTTKEPDKGTGLGLSMVLGLVQQMGGHLDIESFPGKGTTVSVYLPLTEYKLTVPEDAMRTDKTELAGRTVLVVEDEKDLRDIMIEMMQELGLKALSAANGNEAIAIEQSYSGDIDFLLTDVVMPEMNGVRLADRFRQLRPDTHVLYFSGYPAGAKISNIAFPENACLLAKPVQMDVLADAFQNKLENPDWQPPESAGVWRN